MHHLVAASEVGVLVADRVEAVRDRGPQLLRPGAVQRRHVLARQALKRVLVAHAPRGVTCTGLARTEDREVDTRLLHQLRGRDGRLACALVECRRAADPEEDVGGGLTWPNDSHPETLRPLHPVRLRFTPRVRRTIDVAKHRAGLIGKARPDHHEGPAQLDNTAYW